jgi:hypothetical protein
MKIDENDSEEVNYVSKTLSKLESKWKMKSLPASISSLYKKNIGKNRIGYIVATCFPITNDHLVRAQQAANDLDLDAVFFIIMPFHYVRGFHSKTLNGWLEKQHLLQWEYRVDLLSKAIHDLQDTRMHVLSESKCWYEESDNFVDSGHLSAFWTGTWYVIKKFQWNVRRYLNSEAEFTFVCNMNQFNPSINSLVTSGNIVKVRNYYSIAQQLAIHNVYVTPRKIDEIELFKEITMPLGCKNKVIIGKSIKKECFCTTNIRYHQLNVRNNIQHCVEQRIAMTI